VIELLRTDSSHPGFVELVRLLDAHLAIMDGDEHPFYDQYNKLDSIRHVVLALNNGRAVACGAIKPFDHTCAEVKRMYTGESERGRGIAGQVLAELEIWAVELGFQSCILETGKKQEDAIRLYRKAGYSPMENYGQYSGVENSLCFGKKLMERHEK
jgi:GNAT superfamily N-acetyltransferase